MPSHDLLADGYGAVCSINSDSPTLPAGILVDAVTGAVRARRPVVLGPAEDGGYYSSG